MRVSPAAILIVASIVALSWPAAARGGELRLVPGLTPYQQSVATAIDTFCPRLFTPGLALNAVQLDLRARCTEMKQNANVLQGEGGPNPLGLTNAGLANALGAVTTEESNTLGTLSVEAGTNAGRAVRARLRAVRAGAGGLSLGGLPGVADMLASAAGAPGSSEIGGAAPADRGPFGRLGLFVNGEYDFGDRDPTSREDGFEFDRFGVTVGADYRITDRFILGIALHYSDTDTDIDQNLGAVESRGYGVSLYGTYYLGNFYVEGHAGYEYIDYDSTRRIVYSTFDRTAQGETEGNQYTVSLGVGYEISLGRLTITPLARLEYLKLDVDSYREHGAEGLDLTVGKQEVESLMSALGAQVSMAFSVPFGILVPQVRAEWRHEFLNDNPAITAKYVNDPFGTSFVIPGDNPDRDYVALAAGLSVVFRRGVSAFVNYETVLDLKDVTHHAFTGGLRMEF